MSSTRVLGQAHSIVGKLDNTAGKLVQYAITRGQDFGEFTLDKYHSFSPLIAENVYDITVATSVMARNVIGGTAPKQVLAALARARKLIEAEDEKQTD